MERKLMKQDGSLVDQRVPKAWLPRIKCWMVAVLLGMAWFADTTVTAAGRTAAFQPIVNVKGKVMTEAGVPIQGVTVVVKGKSTSVSTDAEGAYALSGLSQGDVLVFSFVGMTTQEVVVGSQSVLNVTMLQDAVGIDEVVVVGYGERKKKTITGSIATVKGDEIVKAPVANVTNTLAGRLPGLIAQQSSGRPGGDASSLSIRGFGGALVIVDGVEADFSTIDASTIESISVLKDGAASIYGARAGNGVILVTTKRGTDAKPIITLSSNYTLQGVTSMPTPVSSGQYAEMQAEAWLQSGKPAETVPYTPEQIRNFYESSDPFLYPNTNWYNELVRDWAPQHQQNLSLRGGSEKVKYYGFLGYLEQATMWKTNGGDYSRFNLQSNIDAKVNDQLSIQLDLSSIYGVNRFPYGSQDPAAGSLWTHFWSALPIYPARFPDPDKLPFTGADGAVHVLSNSDRIGYRNSDSHNIRGNLGMEYKAKWLTGLSVKALMSYNQTYHSEKMFNKGVELYSYDHASNQYAVVGAIGGAQASLSQGKSQNRIVTGQISVNYDRKIATDHQVNAMLLHEMIDYSSDYLSGSRINFLSPAIDQLYAGSTSGMSNTGSATEMGRSSFVGRINYNFREKYILEAILRADASAKFAKDSRWGYFPSVSAGWLVSDERFMDWAGGLDNLKLRASYGESGNDAVGNFQYLSGYGYGRTYMFGSAPAQGMMATGLANPNLTWEEMRISNVGADFSFWSGRLYGELDAFYRNREGIPTVRLATLPSSFGASLPAENINSLTNRGFEAKVGTAGSARGLSWDVSGNISWTRAKWVHFEEPDYEDADQERIYRQSGRWVDRIYGYVSDGLFTSESEISSLPFDQDLQGNTTLRPGDIRYKDTNGDGRLDWKDQIEIGKGTTPQWMAGLNVTLRYKNFDLSTLFQGAFAYYSSISLIGTTAEAYEHRWTSAENNPNSLLPRLGGNTVNNGKSSDFYLKEAGYLRLKNINVGYVLPSAWMDRIGFTQARLFFAGTNLLTFDKLKDYSTDPEAPSGYAGLYYPQQKTLTFGLHFSF